MRFRIPIESFLDFSTPSTLYTPLGGLGAVLAGGVVDGVTLDLAGWVDAGGEG